MEGVILIEGQTLKHWEIRLNNMEQLLLELIKMTRLKMPQLPQSNVTDYISIADACKKYHLSRVAISNKIRQFKKAKNREIDRMQSGRFYLVNEVELQEAISLKTEFKQF